MLRSIQECKKMDKAILKETRVHKKEVLPLLHLRIFGLYGNQQSTSPPKR